MPVTHKGPTLSSLADAVRDLILAADDEAEVIEFFDKSFATGDESQDASRDYLYRNVNRWYVLPYRRRSSRESDIDQCEEPFSMHRRRSAVFYLYFYYSARYEMDGDPDESAEANTEFFHKMDTVENHFSAHPFLLLDGKQSTAYHTDLQLDGVSVVTFRREPCLKATYQLEMLYTDFVKKI